MCILLVPASHFGPVDSIYGGVSIGEGCCYLRHPRLPRHKLDASREQYYPVQLPSPDDDRGYPWPTLHGALGNAIHRARPRRGTHPKMQKGGRAEDPCTSQTENQHEVSPSRTLKTAIFRTIFRGPASGQSEREARGMSLLAAHFQSPPRRRPDHSTCRVRSPSNTPRTRPGLALVWFVDSRKPLRYR